MASACPGLQSGVGEPRGSMRRAFVYRQLRELPDLRRAEPDLGAVHAHVCQTALQRLGESRVRFRPGAS